MNKRQIAALLAEAIGVFTLVLVVLNVSRYGLPFFTAIAAGVTIAVFYSAFSKISGGHFNPAVTLGLFVSRQVSIVRTLAYLAVQMLAAVAAWQVYEYLTERTLKNATNVGLDWRILTAEAVGAAVFGIAIAAVAAQKTQGYQAAYTIGAGLFLGSTVAGLASNGVLNPAVALGARTFDVNYVVGPVVGVIVGMLLVFFVIIPVFGNGKAKTVVATAKAEATTKAKPAAKTASAKKAPAKKKPAAKKSTKK